VRYLAVDPGGRSIGLAVGDDETGVVSPLTVLRSGGARRASGEIAATARRVGAERVVVGLPTTVDGEHTPACRRSEVLAEALRALGLEVELQPEHLSTREARRRAREAGLPASAAVDHLAAQVILEDYLAGR